MKWFEFWEMKFLESSVTSQEFCELSELMKSCKIKFRWRSLSDVTHSKFIMMPQAGQKPFRRVEIHSKRTFLQSQHSKSFNHLSMNINKDNSPSRLMPTAMHFFRRQYWQRLRLTRWIMHCWFLVHGRYWIFCWMERRKKPWKWRLKKILICYQSQIFAVFCVSVYIH